LEDMQKKRGNPGEFTLVALEGPPGHTHEKR